MKKKLIYVFILCIFCLFVSKVSATCTKLTSPSGEVSYVSSQIENWMSQSGYKVESVADSECSAYFNGKDGKICHYEGDGIKAQFQVIKNKNQSYSFNAPQITSNSERGINTISNWAINYKDNYGFLALNQVTVSFTGDEYYEKNGCPPIAFLTEYNKDFYNLLLSDTAHVEEFESAFEKTNTTYTKLLYTKSEDINVDNYDVDYCPYFLLDSENNKTLAYTNIEISKLKTNSQYEFSIAGDKISTFSFKQKVNNWDSAFDKTSFPFVAKQFVEKNNVCPNYALITKSFSGYNLFLSNDQTCDDLNSFFKSKYSTLSDCFTLSYKGTHNTVTPNDNDTSNSEPDSTPTLTSCYENSDETSCVNNTSYSCIWVNGDNGNSGYCNTDTLQYVKCGGAFDIPEEVPRIMSFVINLLKIGTPIILIITGVLALVKAIAASKEDEIKKAQSTLVKKAIAAAFVFLVIGIVQFVILKAADSSDTGNITTCMSCFLNNDCDTDKYFKTKVGSKYSCHYVSNPSESLPCGEDENES